MRGGGGGGGGGNARVAGCATDTEAAESQVAGLDWMASFSSKLAILPGDLLLRLVLFTPLPGTIARSFPALRLIHPLS